MADAPNDNPLLGRETPIPFQAIRAEHVGPAVGALLGEAKAALDAIAAPRETRGFEDTLGALDRLGERLNRAVGVAAHLEAVATTPELREAYAAVQPEVSAFESSVAMNAELWLALKSYATTDEAKGLTGARRRFLDKTLADFRRSGADLAPDGKARLAAIEVELAQITLRFSQNVLDATNAFEIVIEDRARLAGLPESAIDEARASAEAKGKAGYRLTLQASSYFPALTYLDDGALRERLYRAYNARATAGEEDNRPLVARILELRREKATLLGYRHFADLATEDRMAKAGAAAREFVALLRRRAEPFFVRENEELAAFRREIEGDGAAEMKAWDVAYWAEKLRRARFDFDAEELRAFFPLEEVLRGAFGVLESLYGVTIEARPDVATWDPSVRAFAVREGDGRVGSVFYVDVTPRETKRDGAWMDGLITGTGDAPFHSEVFVGSFTPPVGDKPALLTHREVETTFHELGHLVHHASSRVPLLSQAGTNVARDFVELPSQLLENWCWEREALARFARHYVSGAPIPDALFAKMRAARTFRAANNMMRQLGFAELDLALHMEWTQGAGDPVAMAREILARHSPTPLPEDHAMAASFSHLFGSSVGYAAGYYSYKWAEVLEADAFSRFKNEGLFSRDVGTAFRREVLARGDSADPMDLYRAFMGRDPSLEALLSRDGLIAT